MTHATIETVTCDRREESTELNATLLLEGDDGRHLSLIEHRSS
jgi:hypothetical protein